MRHPAPLALLLLAGGLAAAAPALPAEGLYLTWRDCAAGPVAAHDIANACNSNVGAKVLYCAFSVGAPVDSALGVELVVDLQHSAATVPDWWRFDSGACRSGALVADFDFTAETGCLDAFTGLAQGGVTAYVLTEPRGGANQAGIHVAASRLRDYGYMSFDPSGMYYGARLTITNANTVAPATVCTGCDGSACLVLNSVRILRQPGAIGGDVLLSQPGPDNANWATWQAGSGANCASVPARSLTWGRLKSLYR